jgi:agarase
MAAMKWLKQIGWAVSIYLGLASLSAWAAPGYISLQKDGRGVWWFVDGAGKQFFSLAPACTGGCSGGVGDQHVPPNREAILGYLKSWGFNSLGTWSAPNLWHELPYAEEIYHSFDVSSMDAFDEEAWTQAEPEVAGLTKPFLEDRNLIGYYLDNEPPWTSPRGFLQTYLQMGRGEPGSRALVESLKSYYGGDIGRLNAEWDSSYGGFEELPRSKMPPDSYALEQGFLKSWKAQVLSEFYGHYAGLVRRFDPHHLILGERHAQVLDLDVAVAIAKHFDVISINDYNRYGHLKPEFAEIYAATGKPILNSEWSFSGFPKPGQRSLQFVDVYSQANRGRGYSKAVLEAARAPFMVGMHFFLWEDYARQDIGAEGTEGKAKAGKEIMGYEPDENMGLTNSQGRPYEEFVSWCRWANGQVEAAHRAALPFPSPTPVTQKVSIPAFSPQVDGDLGDWAGRRALKPVLGPSLLSKPPFQHSYYLSWDNQALYVAMDGTDSHLDHPADKSFDWEGDCLEVSLEPWSWPDKQQDYSTTFRLYPAGGGEDGNQPRVAGWGGYLETNELPAKVVRKDKPGGFTLEARIPFAGLHGLPPQPASPWKVHLSYQNVNEIYTTDWQGTVWFVK